MDIEKVKKIGKESQESFLAACQNKSDYELTYLNINDHPTPQRRYKQCLDEMVRRVSNIGRAEIDIEEFHDKINKAKDKEASTEGEEQRKWNRKRRKLEISLWETNLALEGQLREFNCFYGLYEQMPKYTAEDIQAAEEEYHVKRKTSAAQRQLEMTGTFDPELLRVMADMKLIDDNFSDNFLTNNQEPKKELTNEPDNDLLQVPSI